jgi:Zn finger protein HypA/HybF involved in hydrogenase expression
MKFKATKYTKEQFIEAVKINYSIRSTLLSLGLYGTGSNYTTFHRNIKILNLDTSHFTGQSHLKGKTHDWNKKLSLDEILVENSTYTSRDNIKKRLLKKNLLKYECSHCSISDWNEKPLSLRLEHINGVNNDHRIENLCLLCPNCHSQTSTYAGRNKKPKSPKHPKPPKPKSIRKIKPKNHCTDCSKEISKVSVRCKPCAGKFREPTKISWPTNEALLKMIKDSNYTQVGRKLGVSDNAVRKRLRNHPTLTLSQIK